MSPAAAQIGARVSLQKGGAFPKWDCINGRQRKSANQSRIAVITPGSPVPIHTHWGRKRHFSPAAVKLTCRDEISPLEGTGFELPVPPDDFGRCKPVTDPRRPVSRVGVVLPAAGLMVRIRFPPARSPVRT